MTPRPARRVIVVGAGVFGVTAALELRRRGHDVTLLDAGAVPNPSASSTDISKAVRMDYGSDTFYADLAARAIAGWYAWNERLTEPPYHQTGILLLSRESLDGDGFEARSFRMLSERGLPLERLDLRRLGQRFPAWSDSGYADGYFNPRAGYVESGRVVAWLAREARKAGVILREHAPVGGFVERGGRVDGVRLEAGERIESEQVLLAAGAWTGFLLPELAELLQPNGQPVVHFRPPAGSRFAPERFPVWCADIANTGRYGFPLGRDGVVKIGRHGPGRRVAAGEALEPSAAERRDCVEYARATFTDLADAEVVRTRLCLYCDTSDGDFLIDHVPERAGLVVAAGGSGHGFKFAPLLGPLIADVVEHRKNPASRRFAWRHPSEGRGEQARQRGTN